MAPRRGRLLLLVLLQLQGAGCGVLPLLYPCPVVVALRGGGFRGLVEPGPAERTPAHARLPGAADEGEEDDDASNPFATRGLLADGYGEVEEQESTEEARLEVEHQRLREKLPGYDSEVGPSTHRAPTHLAPPPQTPSALLCSFLLACSYSKTVLQSRGDSRVTCRKPPPP